MCVCVCISFLFNDKSFSNFPLRCFSQRFHLRMFIWYVMVRLQYVACDLRQYCALCDLSKMNHSLRFTLMYIFSIICDVLVFVDPMWSRFCLIRMCWCLCDTARDSKWSDTLYTLVFDLQLSEILMRLFADISALLALLGTPTYTPNIYPCILCDSASSCTTFKHARIQKTLIFEAYTAYMYTGTRIDFLSLWQFPPQSMCPCLIWLPFLIYRDSSSHWFSCEIKFLFFNQCDVFFYFFSPEKHFHYFHESNPWLITEEKCVVYTPYYFSLSAWAEVRL